MARANSATHCRRNQIDVTDFIWNIARVILNRADGEGPHEYTVEMPKLACVIHAVLVMSSLALDDD